MPNRTRIQNFINRCYGVSNGSFLSFVKLTPDCIQCCMDFLMDAQNGFRPSGTICSLAQLFPPMLRTSYLWNLFGQ